jgi:hypothetical protein
MVQARSTRAVHTKKKCFVDFQRPQYRTAVLVDLMVVGSADRSVDSYFDSVICLQDSDIYHLGI